MQFDMIIILNSIQIQGTSVLFKFIWIAISCVLYKIKCVQEQNVVKILRCSTLCTRSAFFCFAIGWCLFLALPALLTFAVQPCASEFNLPLRKFFFLQRLASQEIHTGSGLNKFNP